MSTTFNWEITKIDSLPQSEDQVNVVAKVYWKCTATQIETVTTTQLADLNDTVGTQVQQDVEHTIFVERNTSLAPYIKGNTFIPYYQLTQSQLLDWVWETKPFLPDNKQTIKELTETELQNTLNTQITPQTVTTPFPWNN